MRAPVVGVAAPRRRLAGLLLACAVLLAGCATAPTGTPAGAGPDTRTIHTPTADGDRTAIVHHPAAAGPGAPLVVVLHGSGGTGAGVRDEVRFDPLAERDGFVVAYPDGVDGTWNAGRCCGRARSDGVDDVGYLHALLGQLIVADAVDGRRVYAVGFSNGAMMTYTWACRRRADLAGIGPVAGALVADCPDPPAITLATVQGTADDRVPVAGNPQRGFPDLDTTLAPFLAAAGCPPAPAVATAGAATVSAWTCAHGRTVTRDVIDGAPHSWPGAGRGSTGTTDSPLDATGFLWARLRSASGA